MAALEREGQTFFFLELVGAKEITSQRSVHIQACKTDFITKLSAMKL